MHQCRLIMFNTQIMNYSFLVLKIQLLNWASKEIGIGCAELLCFVDRYIQPLKHNDVSISC